MFLIVSVLTAVLILAACELKFKVSFDVNGGSPVESISVDRKSLLNEFEIPTPTKPEHTFAGWYKDKSLSKQWDFSKDKVNKNLTLYAKYLPVQSVFSFTLNPDGQSYAVSANPSGSLGILGALILPSSHLGKPVTAVAADAFSGTIPSKVITGVRVPSSIVTIGEKAFYNCKFMNEITFDDGSSLKEIGVSAFEGLPLLRSVSFPASLEKIGENAFKGNLLLQTVTFDGESVLKTIDKHAFSGCLILENVGINDDGAYTLPNTLLTVGERAFDNDAKLKNTGFKKGSSLEKIGAHAFNKTALASLFLPKTLTTVESYAFTENQSLVSVEFEAGSTIENIPGYMFSNCLSLSSIDIPASVKTIGNNAFLNTKSLKKVRMNSLIAENNLFDHSRILETESKATAVIVPAEHLESYKANNSSYKKYISDAAASAPGGEPSEYTRIIADKYLIHVQRDGSGSFKNSLIVYFGNDENLAINGTASNTPALTEIGKFAFAGSRNLKSVVISNASGYTVAGSAFLNCAALETANVSGAVSVGVSAFSGTGLKSVTFGEGLTAIGGAAFQNCKKLTSVSLPASLTEIGGFAFSGCSSLETVSAFKNGSLEKIGNSAFKDASALSDITFPDAVNYIGDGAFWNCSSLSEVIIPANLTEIKSNLFRASGLQRVAIPALVTAIEPNAFGGCTALAEIDFLSASALVSIGESAFAADKNKGFNFENAEFNSKLHSVVLPSSVTSVGANAFARTMVKVITVGSLINVKTEKTADGSTVGVPDLSALLTLNGRAVLIDAPADGPIYAAYKTDEKAKYAENPFVVNKADVDSNGFIIGGTNSDTLIAYIGTESNPNLSADIAPGKKILIIGKYAFAYCIKLIDLGVPVNVGVIEESAFESCINLESIEFADKTGTTNSYGIGKYAFKNCVNAGKNDDVILRGPIDFIGANAFSGWSNDQSITFDGINRTEASKGWATYWDGECYAIKKDIPRNGTAN
jgi:uncharacterized repeat protein (TIGR02543 family)